MTILSNIDDTLQAEVSKETNLPKQLVALRVSANRWFAVTLALVAVCGGMSVMMYSMFDRVDERTEVHTILMYPDGSWKRQATNFNAPQEYFPATVDHLLKRYVRVRYGQVPETITRDFGEARLFMGPEEAAQFVDTSPAGFNAVQKAADVSADPARADRIEIQMPIPLDHYDTLNGNFGEGKREVHRTNIPFVKLTRGADGTVKSQKRMLLRMQWTLLPKKELKTWSSEQRDLNPLGIQTVSIPEQVEDTTVLQPTTLQEQNQ